MASKRENLHRLYDLTSKLKRLAQAALERHRRREERRHTVLPGLAARAMKISRDGDRRAYQRAQEHHRKVSELHDKLARVLGKRR